MMVLARTGNDSINGGNDKQMRFGVCGSFFDGVQMPSLNLQYLFQRNHSFTRSPSTPPYSLLTSHLVCFSHCAPIRNEHLTLCGCQWTTRNATA